MSIKQYVQHNTQQDWVDYIIQTLNGTCNDLSPYLEEYLEEGYDEDYLLGSIDEEIHNCDSCGWWVAVGETDEEGNCEDCQ